MESSDTEAPTVCDEAPEVESPEALLLEWRRHPAGDQPRVAVLLSIGMALSVVLVWLILRSALLTGLSVLLICGSLTDFWLPCRYRLTTEGVERHGPVGRRRLAWPRVAVAYELEDGVLVTPRSRQGWLDAYHGIFLPFEGRRDEVIAIVREYATERRGAEDAVADD